MLIAYDRSGGFLHFSAWGDSIGNVHPLFQFIKINLQANSEVDHSPLLKTLHRTSSKIHINFRLPSGTLLDKLLGWPQLDLSSVDIQNAGLNFAPLCWYINSHQAHYRLLICVCPVTPWIAAWSPWWVLILPTAEPADSCNLCNFIPFEWWQTSLPNGGIGKSYTGTRVTFASCHHGS